MSVVSLQPRASRVFAMSCRQLADTLKSASAVSPALTFVARDDSNRRGWLVLCGPQDAIAVQSRSMSGSVVGLDLQSPMDGKWSVTCIAYHCPLVTGCTEEACQSRKGGVRTVHTKQNLPRFAHIMAPGMALPAACRCENIDAAGRSA